MIKAFVHRLFTVCTVADPDLTIWRGQIENKKFRKGKFFYFKKKKNLRTWEPAPAP